MDTFINVVVFILFTFFLISSVLKLMNLRVFIRIVIDYHLLPKKMALGYGAMVPFIELGGAIFVLSDQTLIYGLTVLLFLLLSFLYAVLKVLKAKKNIVCGCYGRLIEAPVDFFTLYKIFILLFLILFVIVTQNLFVISYSPWSITMGIYINVLFFTAQKIWEVHQATMRQLINQNGDE